MRFWRNRRGQTVNENRREALDDETVRWHRIEILVEATAAQFDTFGQAISDAAFDAEPDGSDAYISAESDVLSPSERGTVLTITDKGEPVSLHIEGLSLDSYVRGDMSLDVSNDGPTELAVTVLVDRVQIGERPMVEITEFWTGLLPGSTDTYVRNEPRRFGR